MSHKIPSFRGFTLTDKTFFLKVQTIVYQKSFGPTFITIVVKKYFYFWFGEPLKRKELFSENIFFLKWLTKLKLEISFDFNVNESCKGGHKQNFGES